MSSIIPTLVSDSPPPPPSEEDEDDEYDDFRESIDISYDGCETFLSTPEQSLATVSPEVISISKHNSELDFKPVYPEAGKDSFVKITGHNIESGNNNLSVVHIEPSKQDICELTSSKFSKDDFHENDVTNRVNIPGQLNFESRNVEKLDNTVVNITKDIHELHIENKDIDLVNGLINSKSSEDSKENLESCVAAFNSESTYSTKDSCENNPESGLFTSSNEKGSSPGYKCDSEILKNELFDFSIPTFTVKVCKQNEDKEIDDHFSSNHLDFIQVNKDSALVKDKVEELSSNKNVKQEIESKEAFLISNRDGFKTNITHSLETSNDSIIEIVDSNALQNIRAEFTSFEYSSNGSLKMPVESFRDDLKLKQDDCDDFANFTSFSISDQNKNTPVQQIRTGFIDISPEDTNNGSDSENKDDFVTFDSFQAKYGDLLKENKSSLDPQISDDDFGEFTSITTPFKPSQTQEFSKSFFLLNDKESFKKTDEIIKDFFSSSDVVLDDFQYFELGEGDTIFTLLQDITDTPAMEYHWSKSTSQKLLLKSLNIDSRNILYNHTWNSSVPRFATNMGVQPLEPIKMEPLTSSQSESIPGLFQNSQPESVELPSAQFDWMSSGLVNPLDSSDSSPTQSAKMESPPRPNEDYEEFRSFQPSKSTISRPHITLRETHISDVSQVHIDMDVVLQPTIVTPELPRKTITTDDAPEFNETSLESKDNDTKQNVDEEFNDFQMFFPLNKDLKSKKKIDEATLKNNMVIDDNQEVIERHIESENVSIKIKDEDFTEFHSSVSLPQLMPEAQTSISVPVLQPTLTYTTPISTQINWPDPGITIDELKRFEEAFTVPLDQKIEKSLVEKQTVHSEKHIEEVKESQPRSSIIWDIPPRYIHKNPEVQEQLKKTESKQNSLEDEEWSDFVSVQKPSPVHKTKFADRTQNSSPDLTLSVLNLSSIQPTKQPIPVITPQGLVQTKLSANITPVVQPKLVNPKPSYESAALQPSIISDQYASQAYKLGLTLHTSHIQQNGHDDDEWGEFVSSPLPPQFQNSTTTVGSSAWNNFAPSNQSNSGQVSNQGIFARPTSGRSFNTNIQRKSSTISGLALPEMDFMSLKERVGVSRKK